ncbi:hypothetical protein KUA17_23250 [Vibrio parahaemolyticus]|uniref:hypothetical protein n=1 Tax=Vibrio parahaemolyticus TaxID=670 RepID=UPI001F27D964|nr:hypothetical protein [Vibrio parahaemolyticus]MCG0031153.1 hypothetical protein [Vibrio parahaemolyticus]
MKFLGSGSFSDVYDLENGTVFKAYKRINLGETPSNQDDNDAFIKAVYRAELKAYEKVQSESGLCDHFAVFYGVANPTELLTSVDGYKDKYVDGCGLIIEYIEGHETKMPHVDSKIFDEVDKVLDHANEILSPLGINPFDASCFNFGNGKFKLIDFGLWLDDEKFYESVLTENLKFSDAERSEIAREFAT